MLQALFALTQKTPAALEAVSPLLERVAATRARLQGDMPVSEPCSLASTIIKAGGAQALPRAAAAALVRLLGCEGVVEQLPADAVWQAVRYGLAEGQRHGADLPDTVAQALQEKLVEYGETGMSPLRVGCQLHRCGASPDIVRRAAASMLLHADGPGRLCGYSPEEWRDVLDCLVECSICERLDVCGSDPRVGEGEVVEGEGSLAAPAAASPAGALRSTSMPLAALAMEAFRGLAAAAARDGSMQLVLEEDAQAAVSVLETASILERRLEGLQARRSELLDCLHAVLDSVVVGSMDQVVSKPLPKDSPVWSLAEAAFALGEFTAKRLHVGHRLAGRHSVDAPACTGLARKPSTAQALGTKGTDLTFHARYIAQSGPFGCDLYVIQTEATAGTGVLVYQGMDFIVEHAPRPGSQQVARVASAVWDYASVTPPLSCCVRACCSPPCAQAVRRQA